MVKFFWPFHPVWDDIFKFQAFSSRNLDECQLFWRFWRAREGDFLGLLDIMAQLHAKIISELKYLAVFS
jgi:hypothetical protein